MALDGRERVEDGYEEVEVTRLWLTHWKWGGVRGQDNSSPAKLGGCVNFDYCDLVLPTLGAGDMVKE